MKEKMSCTISNDMKDIQVNKTDDTKDGWLFSVTVGGNEFEVELDEHYWWDISEQRVSPEEFVRKSFKFLLDRESSEEILTNFNLKVIQNYFPEYEDEIAKIG